MNLTTIGHHTLADWNNIQDIIKNGPVLAIHSILNNSFQFLGSGYYFWDNNIDLAHFWGEKRYSNFGYTIYSADLEFNNTNLLLDLVGRREHQILFQELKKLIIEYDSSRIEWGVGEIIETLKIISNTKQYNGIFPFFATRAQDNTFNSKENDKFVKGKQNYTNLNPRIVICLYNINNEILKNFKCIYCSNK